MCLDLISVMLLNTHRSHLGLAGNKGDRVPMNSSIVPVIPSAKTEYTVSHRQYKQCQGGGDPASACVLLKMNLRV